MFSFTMYTVGTAAEPVSRIPATALRELRPARAPWYRAWLHSRTAGPRLALACYVLGQALVGQLWTSLGVWAGLVLAAWAVASAAQACKCRAAQWRGKPQTAAEENWAWPEEQVGVWPEQVSAQSCCGPAMEKHLVPDLSEDQLAARARAGSPLGDGRMGSPLRIVVLTVGTRGDVEPFIVWGAWLAERGHNVCIASTDNFHETVESRGMHFASIGVPQIEQPTAWVHLKHVADMMVETFKGFHGGYHKAALGFARAVFGAALPAATAADALPGWLRDACSAAGLDPAHGADRQVLLGNEQFVDNMHQDSGGWNHSVWKTVAEAGAASMRSTIADDWYGQKLLGLAGGLTATEVAQAADHAHPVGGGACADLIVATGHTLTFGLNLSEAAGIPVWVAKLAPETPSVTYAPPGEPTSSWGWLNMARHVRYWAKVFLATRRVPIEAMEQAHRSIALGLAPFSPSSRSTDINSTPFLGATSVNLWQPPLDWSPLQLPVGNWQTISETRLDDGADAVVEASGWTPPEWLMPWITANAQQRAPLVVVTFGSMLLAAENGTIEACVHSALECGAAVLLLTGWAPMPASLRRWAPDAAAAQAHPTDVQEGIWKAAPGARLALLRAAPHDVLLPLASVVAHHGGAGTTAKAAALGVPALAIPVLTWSDQMLYSESLASSGVGATVHPRGNADGTGPDKDAVARAMRSLLHSPSIRERAQLLAARIKAEPACHTAGLLIETCLCDLICTREQREQLSCLPLPENLSMEQLAALKHCVPCARARRVGALR